MRKKERKEKVLPIEPKFNKLTRLPHRSIDRALMLLPKLTKSRTDIAEPTRAKERIETVEPSWQESTTLKL
jgi:hypothetical protein